MKTKTLLVSAAITACLLGGSAVADGRTGAIQSPRGAVLAKSLEKRAGTSVERVKASPEMGSPRMAENQRALRRVPGALAGGRAHPNITAPPRLIDNEPWRAETFEVAPLK